MTKSPRKKVLDVGIQLGAACMPSVHASDQATMPGPFSLLTCTLQGVSKKQCLFILFSENMRPRRSKLGTHVDSGQLYHVYLNQAAVAYLSLSSFFFLSNFQTLKFFITLFSGTVRPRKMETWYIHGQWADVSCIRNQAAAAYLSLLISSFFLSLQFSNIKIFHHTFLRNCDTRGQWANVSCIPG